MTRVHLDRPMLVALHLETSADDAGRVERHHVEDRTAHHLLRRSYGVDDVTRSVLVNRAGSGGGARQFLEGALFAPGPASPR
jgi:hypothetical protein